MSTSWGAAWTRALPCEGRMYPLVSPLAATRLVSEQQRLKGDIPSAKASVSAPPSTSVASNRVRRGVYADRATAAPAAIPAGTSTAHHGEPIVAGRL